MDKLWLKQYQAGVPHEINTDEYASLVHLFEETCETYASNVAYVNMGCELTYAKLNRLSTKLAIHLQQLGLKKGDRVGIMMPNVLQYPLAIFAILRAGLVVVNINPLYTSDELIYQVNDAGLEVLIVLANFANTVEKSMAKMPTVKQVIVTQIGDLFPPVKRILVNFVVKYIKKMVPSIKIENAITLHQALKHSEDAVFQRVTSLHHEDIAFLQYTGGTTGVSKGAVLTHGNMVSNVLQAYAWISPLGVNQKDIMVTALPLYHIFSLTANGLTFLKMGAKNILITNPRDIPRFINEIKHSQFTAITGVNTLFNALLNHKRFKEVDFSSLKLALSGGMALQRSVAQRWKEVTHSKILEAYGLTETCPAVTINPMYLEDYNGSIGLPISSTDISVRNDEGQELSLNTAGELCVKGPQVMAGYWKRPEETQAVFWPDGYLRTGDIVKVDDKGFVYLVDRKKDMILVSGFNVYPNEVEQVIGMMPGVLEVGVVGILKEDGIERVKACIVKRDPNLTSQEVLQHCREHLTPYKIPRIVEFYDELPKTNVGKILRRALK